MNVPPCIPAGLAAGLRAAPGPDPNAIPDGAQAFARLLGLSGPGPTDVAGPENGGPLRPSAAKASGISGELVDVLTRIRRDERTLERSVRRALAGHDFELPQLVALQSLAFKYSQRVELLGKLVDRLTNAVKQTLQMQV